MRWPLRRQIMVPLLAVAAASLLAVGVGQGLLAARSTRQRIEQQLQGVVSVLARSSFPLSNTVLRQMRELSGAELVLADDAGRLLGSSFRHPPPSLPASRPASRIEDLKLGERVSVGGKPYFHASYSLARRADASQGRRLHILFPAREYSRSWREAFLPPLAVGVATLGAVALVAHMLAGRIGRTTARLGDEVQRMAEGDFTPAAVTGPDDEIGDLSRAVNRMAEKLTDYERQIRRTEQIRTAAMLGAGIAHEMRNAATGCRMAIDLHAGGCTTRSDADGLAVAKQQLKLMESQLQRFLRAGKPMTAAAKAPVNLAEVVGDMVNLVSHAVRHAGAAMQWTPPSIPLVVLADREALGQVVLNVLLNAIDAVQKTPSGAERRLRVTLARVEQTAELGVCDSGPGPAEELSQSLFDPFVTSKPEGVGLGLAVAREIVEDHGGRITWRRAGDETQFTVVLPLA